MEYPNLNLDSQIVGYCCSLSLPSEPPDIRNWFPSYAYESPLLGTSDNCAYSVSQERECEKDECVGEEDNGDQGNFGISATDCEVSGYHSLSLPSEPPDVGKWFSSYAYESPVLDAGFQDSHFKEGEHEDEGFVEESDIENEVDLGNFRRMKKRDDLTNREKISPTGFVKCNDSIHNNKVESHTSNKIADSSDSFSPSSAPPDVGIWFSSYVYESPLLDTEFQDSHVSQRKCMKNEFLVENNIDEDTSKELRAERDISEITVGKKESSNELAKCNGVFEEKKLENQSLSKDDDNGGEGTKPSPHNELSPGSSYKRVRTLQTRVARPAKGIGESSVKEEDCLEKVDQFSQEDDPVSLIIKRRTTQMKKTKRKNSATMDQPKDKENGFVSIRKKRCANVESSLKTSHGSSLKGCDEKEGVVERKVLADKSNMQHSHSIVGGKWRCPQKGKPNLGPPMKQLRLDQWVHRI